MPYLQSLVGIAAIVALAWALSENRRAFAWQTVLVGLALQIGLAALLLGVDWIRGALYSLNAVVEALAGAMRAGTSFVFGYVGGGEAPFDVTRPGHLTSLAFQVLPLVIVVSALSAVLWYWRVLPVVVRGFSLALQKTMNIGGAVGLGAAANVFLGMIESPLLIRPYLARLTRSELFMVFTVGLATVAGTVLVLYATVLEPVVPGAVGHILVASLMSLPAAILIARVMVPGTGETTADDAATTQYHSTMDAVARGTEDGLRLYLSIIAMLIVIIALVALANMAVGVVPDVGGAPLTIERILGWLFAPAVWAIGIPWDEAAAAGALMGEKAILNEFIAYLHMASLPADALSPRSRLIMLYAMCGFANLGSVGMMIAAVSAMVPERRKEVVSLSLRAIISGNLATLMTGAVVGAIPFD